MKSVKEINAIIHKLVKEVNDLENQGSKLLDEAKTISANFHGTRFAKVADDPEVEKWHAIHAAADNAYIKAGELKKIIVVWKFNLLHAKKAELLPIWAGVMREYEGKKIGAIREKEISDKLHNLGITGYFSKYAYSSPKINLSFLDNNGHCSYPDYIELTGNYQVAFFDNENKFKLPDLETFKFYGEGTPYIENPRQYIKQLEKLATKAKTTAAAYDKALHAYNAAAVPGFAQIDAWKDNPGSIAEYFRITR